MWVSKKHCITILFEIVWVSKKKTHCIIILSETVVWVSKKQQHCIIILSETVVWVSKKHTVLSYYLKLLCGFLTHVDSSCILWRGTWALYCKAPITAFWDTTYEQRVTHYIRICTHELVWPSGGWWADDSGLTLHFRSPFSSKVEPYWHSFF